MIVVNFAGEFNLRKMSNRKISELPLYKTDGEILYMAVIDYSNVIHRVNLNHFDFTEESEALKKVKESIEKYGHVLVIPFKPI